MTSLAAAPPERRAPRWATRHETLLAAVLIVALAILGAYNDRFLTLDNLLNQGRLMAEVGLIAMPMTFVIITGGIDLSVGSVVGGVSILGGVGTVVGSTFAAILIAEIASALVFVSISPYWIRAVQGGLILLTVVADIVRRRRRASGDSR